jgi:predicted nucleic-acid-binding Zn-ribbon protein
MGILGKRKRLFDSTREEHYTHTYTLQGKAISCPHCGHAEFDEQNILLNTPGMTFFGLDWANRTATVLCCRNCGRIDWYLRKPEEVR